MTSAGVYCAFSGEMRCPHLHRPFTKVASSFLASKNQLFVRYGYFLGDSS